MDDEEPFAFDDLWLDSDATVGVCSCAFDPAGAGLLQETAMEVHVWDLEVEAL